MKREQSLPKEVTSKEPFEPFLFATFWFPVLHSFVLRGNEFAIVHCFSLVYKTSRLILRSEQFLWVLGVVFPHHANSRYLKTRTFAKNSVEYWYWPDSMSFDPPKAVGANT
jgi:hypothetical protein